VSDKTVNYIAAIIMPVILFVAGLMCSQIANIQTRLHRVELYVSRIGVKVGLEPLQANDFKGRSTQPVLASSNNKHLGDTK
jgi:hypothetical protein